MFWDDIRLVTQQIEKYGLRESLADIGGQSHPTIADYEITISTGDQEGRFISLPQRPFDHIDPHYKVLEEDGDWVKLQNLPIKHRKTLGTALCLGVLEHAEHPIMLMESMYALMRDNSLLIVTSAFSYPYQNTGKDYWRLSPDALRSIGSKAGFHVLESGWYIELSADKGIKDPKTGIPHEVRACYVTLGKGKFVANPAKTYSLPHHNKQSAGAPAPQEIVAPVVLPSPIAQKKLSCVFVNTYYDAFLDLFYKKNPALASAPYQLQLQELQAQAFGDSTFYSQGLENAGWSATNLIVNCDPLQRMWLKEKGINLPAQANWMHILLEQLRQLKPDVIYIQDMHAMSRELLQAMRESSSFIAGQIASSIRGIPLESYDLIISSFEQFVAWFRELKIPAYYQPLAFDPELLQRLPKLSFQERDVQCSFVGSLVSRVHKDREVLLKILSERSPVDFWGSGVELLPENSPIRARYKGEAWGLEMFSVLARSKMTVNCHGEVTGCAGPLSLGLDHNLTRFYANNMRLFEATGCGSLLITDYKDNLNELFEVGKEVVAYRSPEECGALIRYYSDHPAEAEKIALAGQKRTLSQHSYGLRLAHSAEVLERHLRYKSEAHKLPQVDLNRISYDYKNISAQDLSPELSQSWKSAEIPLRQRALVQGELEQMQRGNPPPPFKTLAKLVKSCIPHQGTVLEIGCSSGYYYEVLEYLLNRKIRYTGVDYSEAMIQMAKAYYPKARFEVADGAHLPFANQEFEMVISGCVLLHCPNYSEHIKETARVSKNFIVLHRTPVCRSNPTQFLSKKAYDVETVELRFSEQELLRLVGAQGFTLVEQIEYESRPEADQFDVSYLFRRQ